MKYSTKGILAITFGILIIFCIAAPASAGHFGRGRKGPAHGRGIMGLKTFIELNLSEDQKTEALAIIEAYETYKETTKSSLREAKENLSVAKTPGNFTDLVYIISFAILYILSINFLQ